MQRFHFAVMTLWLAALAGLAALVPGAAHADSLPPSTVHHLGMTLVAETATPPPGSDVTLAIDTRPAAGWHGYWSNPGDAGFPAKLDWTLPRGVTASAPRYPMPGTLLVAGLMNYVFKAPYAPLVTLTVPKGMKPGTALPVALHLSYLVCTDTMCVPEDADLTLNLTVGDGAIAPDTRAQFDAWRKAIPKPLGATAHYQIDGSGIRLAIPYPASTPLADAYFFAETTGAIDFAAPQTVTRDGDTLIVASKAKPFAQPIDGVLRIGADQGLEVHALPGTVPAAGVSPQGNAEGWAQSAIWAFLGAVLGGLILNIMPCVFPILSLKALSLARSGGAAEGARREALAYTAGVIMVCVALGVVILVLRAGGSVAGWAFQLQNPGTILLLLMLSVAIALNFAGLFEVPMPRFATHGGGAGGAFATGALAAFVATPCAGPFMGVALGAALVLPWPAALAVFAGLGLGLALPFLAIGFIPALRRILPKPGAWMETFRHILSIPMWLTAVALAWVLGKQAGVNGMAVGLLAALVAGVALWIAGRRQRRGSSFGMVAIVLLVAAAAAGVWLAGSAKPTAAASATSVNGEQAFSEARLAALRKEGRPVFAYFTADWCLICKVNERTAIDASATQAAFARHKVAVLVGDWTNGDPVLGRFIEAHNRAGVPLYLYYAPGAAEPQVLPQVLTPGMLEALAG